MAMYHILNTRREMVVINVPGEDGKSEGLYLPARGRVALTEEQYASVDVQAKVREGVLRREQVT